ncbi:MAG: Vacuolar protein sorting-associated protein 29 [Chrysothrix sp. TS-e1954]|nr:MAG: Vacuolar protein sorting-associated protein 29 [Chrysothrix sp. TS-e1954]
MASRLVLVLGDLFIPDRAIDIPAKFKKLLTPNKIGLTLCLGNLTSPFLHQYLHSLSPTLETVRGDFDTSDSLPPNTPYQKVITHGSLRIGIIHGHTVVPHGDADELLIVARQMDVDVLCWGGTCRFEAWEMEGRFFVNPGSATGATSWGWDALEEAGETEGEGSVGTPSFVLMDVQGTTLVVYVYQLKTNQDGVENVSVEKVTFSKNVNTTS